MANHLELGDFAGAKDNGLRKAMLGIGNDYFEKAKKGGEGSRGGKVIGHTKSGKAVYGDKKAHEYENFTPADHINARSLHQKLANENYQTFNKKGGSGPHYDKSSHKAWMHHEQMSARHHNIRLMSKEDYHEFHDDNG